MATYESEYTKYFNEIRALGFGGFSTVYKSEHKVDKNVYAIKKIAFKTENEASIIKELNILSKLNSNFAVKYVNSWIEPNYYLDPENKHENTIISGDLYSFDYPRLLHIQMELCALTLRDIINILKEKCLTFGSLSLIGYYIASELFYEILECVHYLHSRTPAIIHRDLKPENILITYFDNKRFVKLSDFGLSTFHEFADQSHTKYKGTKNYIAFELNFSTKYSTKADIYSLGVIMQELFHIDINETSRKYFSEIKTKMNYIEKLMQQHLSFIPEHRPNCDQIMLEKDNWLLDDEEILNDKTFSRLLKAKNLNVNIEENFIEFFIQNKYKLQTGFRMHSGANTRPSMLNNLLSNQNNSLPLMQGFRMHSGANTRPSMLNNLLSNQNNSLPLMQGFGMHSGANTRPSIVDDLLSFGLANSKREYKVSSSSSNSSIFDFDEMANNMNDEIKEPLTNTASSALNTSPESHLEETDYEYLTVFINKSDKGMGLKIFGGTEDRNVAIGSIVVGGEAHQNGVLKVGDEIISINEHNVAGKKQQDVVQLILHSGNTVKIQVRRKVYSTLI